MIGEFRTETTPAQHDAMQHEIRMAELHSEHAKAIKSMDIELAKLEAKWNSWLALPKTIIKLPILVIMAVAYCIAVARGIEPSTSFWNFMR